MKGDPLMKITTAFSKFMLLYFSVDAMSTRVLGYVLKRAGF